MGWTIGVIFILMAIGEFKIVGIFKKIKGTLFSQYDMYLYIPLFFINYIWKIREGKILRAPLKTLVF